MKKPLAILPVQSDHGDVHHFEVSRTNGDSLTVDEFRYVFAAVIGRPLAEDEIDVVRHMFAEEDR